MVTQPAFQTGAFEIYGKANDVVDPIQPGSRRDDGERIRTQADGTAVAAAAFGSHMRRILAVAISLLTTLFAGCDPSAERPEERTAPALPESGPGLVVIRMLDDMTFDPQHAVVKAGDTVVWVNAGDLPHTATADPRRARDPSRVALPEGAGSWDSGSIEARGEFREVLTVPGRYAFVCTFHEMMGMVGTLEVEF